MLLWIMVALADEPPTAVDTSTRVLQQLRAQYATGAATSDDVYRWSVRVMESERAAGATNAATAHLNRMRDLQKTAADLAGGGIAPEIEVDATAFYVAEATAWASEEPEVVEEPAAPAAPGDIDACFASCNTVYEKCSTTANNYRLGVGALTGGDARCEERAESKCGAGKSSTKMTCRDAEIRECQAAKMLAECASEQTMCHARCR